MGDLIKTCWGFPPTSTSHMDVSKCRKVVSIAPSDIKSTKENWNWLELYNRLNDIGYNLPSSSTNSCI
jgi:hypothetical protein